MRAGCGDESAKEYDIEQTFRRHGDSMGWTGRNSSNIPNASQGDNLQPHTVFGQVAQRVVGSIEIRRSEADAYVPRCRGRSPGREHCAEGYNLWFFRAGSAWAVLIQLSAVECNAVE
jgi:hypothetical protein